MNKIPFTNPEDLQKPERFFTVPESKFTKIFSSSGTTGKPKAAYFTKNDLEKQISRNATGTGVSLRIFLIGHSPRRL